MPTAAKVQDTSAARIELEVEINAPREKVWQTITEKPDAWWISELRCVSSDSVVRLDARAGGTMVEESPSGGGILWFTVIAVQPNESLNLAGAIAPPWGGPSNAFLYVQLEEKGDSTVVKITNSVHGLVDPEMVPQMEAGWRMLFENGLKSVVETGARV